MANNVNVTPQIEKIVQVTKKNKVVVRSPGIAGPKGDPGTQTLTGPGAPSNLIGNVGDLYIDITQKNTYGPKTVSGWPPLPLLENFNRDLLGQVFSVGTAAEVWTIQHNLGYNPNATVLDSSGAVVEGDIQYPDENTIILTFVGAISGKAYLS